MRRGGLNANRFALSIWQFPPATAFWRRFFYGRKQLGRELLVAFEVGCEVAAAYQLHSVARDVFDAQAEHAVDLRGIELVQRFVQSRPRPAALIGGLPLPRLGGRKKLREGRLDIHALARRLQKILIRGLQLQLHDHVDQEARRVAEQKAARRPVSSFCAAALRMTAACARIKDESVPDSAFHAPTISWPFPEIRSLAKAT